MRKKILLISLFLCLFLSSCSVKTITYPKPPIYLMDTVISVNFYNVKDNDKYYKEIKSIFKDIDNVSNDYKSGNEIKSIYDLNINREINASDTLKDLVSEALYYYEDTNGYFNPFIGSLTHMWKESLDNGIIPNDEDIKNEIIKMNESSLIINGNNIKINGESNIDLGAIAKGYAAYKSMAYLKDNNITSYSIDAGNSSIVLGNKNNIEFNIALLDPNSNIDNPKYIGVFSDFNTTISSSSPMYQNKIIDSIKYHHLLNPFTGYPSNIYDSVFVICDNPLKGDVYSTAIFNMNLDEAISFSSEKNVSIILYKDNTILYKSEGIVIK